MRDQEPNWGLAFGSGSFLIVWCLGLVSGVPFEVSLGRATVAAVMGTLLGVVVGYTLSGLKNLRADMDGKGARVDFTVGDEELIGRVPAPEAGPEAGSTTQERVVPAAEQPFKPIDYKSSAKQVHSVAQE